MNPKLKTWYRPCQLEIAGFLNHQQYGRIQTIHQAEFVEFLRGSSPSYMCHDGFPWDEWYILPNMKWLIFYGKCRYQYTSPMDPMGVGIYWDILGEVGTSICPFRSRPWSTSPFLLVWNVCLKNRETPSFAPNLPDKMHNRYRKYAPKHK